jgi:RNA polymerase sigma-70 factor (ECF subfamily)
MTTRKKLSDEEIKRRLIADAQNPNGWEPLGVVSPTASPRPAWYGQSRRAELRPVTGSSSEPKDVRFTAAYRRHYARVVRYYMRAFNLAEDEAKDLAQQAFVRFYEAIEHYRGEAEWAFLETVVRNVAYNRVRALKSASRSAKVVSIEDARLELLIVSHPDADHTSGQEEALRRMQLHDAIAALPEGQRHCIQLWLDGFHYSDIASVLGVSMDAVKSRLRDARHRLRPSVDASSDDTSPSDQRTGGGTAR